MKLNNKGFTLVELLGVIIILVVILLIAIPSITSTVSRNKDQELEAKQQLIVAETKLYAEAHQRTEANFIAGTCSYSTQKLQELSIVSEENLLDSDGNLIIGCVYYNNSQKQYQFQTTCTITPCS